MAHALDGYRHLRRWQIGTLELVPIRLPPPPATTPSCSRPVQYRGYFVVGPETTRRCLALLHAQPLPWGGPPIPTTGIERLVPASGTCTAHETSGLHQFESACKYLRVSISALCCGWFCALLR